MFVYDDVAGKSMKVSNAELIETGHCLLLGQAESVLHQMFKVNHHHYRVYIYATKSQIRFYLKILLLKISVYFFFTQDIHVRL